MKSLLAGLVVVAGLGSSLFWGLVFGLLREKPLPADPPDPWAKFRGLGSVPPGRPEPTLSTARLCLWLRRSGWRAP